MKQSADTTEFGKPHELSEASLKDIDKEYFKGAIVPYLVTTLITGIIGYGGIGISIYNLFEWTVIPISLCCAMALYGFYRLIMALIYFPKIKKREFLWYAGNITGRKADSLIEWGKKRYMFYEIDDKYYCTTLTSPAFYKKGTAVYLLYFPGPLFFRYLDGAVVRIKP